MTERTEPSPGVFRHVPGVRAGLILMLGSSVATLLSDIAYRLVEHGTADQMTADPGAYYLRLTAIFMPFDFAFFLGLCLGLALLARVPKTTGAAVGAIACGVAAWVARGALFLIPWLAPSSVGAKLQYAQFVDALLGSAAVALIVLALWRAAAGIGAKLPRALIVLLFALVGIGLITTFTFRAMVVTLTPANDPTLAAAMFLNSGVYYLRQLLLIAAMVMTIVTQPKAG